MGSSAVGLVARPGQDCARPRWPAPRRPAPVDRAVTAWTQRLTAAWSGTSRYRICAAVAMRMASRLPDFFGMPRSSSPARTRRMVPSRRIETVTIERTRRPIALVQFGELGVLLIAHEEFIDGVAATDDVRKDADRREAGLKTGRKRQRLSFAIDSRVSNAHCRHWYGEFSASSASDRFARSAGGQLRRPSRALSTPGFRNRWQRSQLFVRTDDSAPIVGSTLEQIWLGATLHRKKVEP